MNIDARETNASAEADQNRDRDHRDDNDCAGTMSVDEYLARIGCSELRHEPPSLTQLTRLQQAHMRAVAFENLDMHLSGRWRQPIVFSLRAAYERVVQQRRRGGFCLQLNGLFAWLLRQLGFSCSLVPGYFYNQQLGFYYRLPIHMVLVVRLPRDDLDSALHNWYVDVGTLRSLNEPVRIEPDSVQWSLFGTNRFRLSGDFYELERSRNGQLDAQNNKDKECGGGGGGIEPKLAWMKQIKFRLAPSDFESFRPINDWVQTVEHPVLFYRTVVCRHVLLADGQAGIDSLVGSRLIETRFAPDGETRTETLLGVAEARAALRDRFGIQVGDERDLDNSAFEPVDQMHLYVAPESQPQLLDSLPS